MMVHQNLYAVEVERLYEAEVIAKSEQEQDRVAAFKQALERVLLRILSGNDILQDETVNSVLANASQYVEEYQYSLAEAGHKDERMMRVLFDEELLISTLRPGKIALWNEIRSRTLVWLVVEKNGAQQFFDPDEMPGVDKALKKASKQKRIPVLLPMQDLREKRILSISDVLSAYSEHLLEVSVRYEVVSTLAGKVVKYGHCWKAEWTLYFNAKIEQWRSPCSSVDGVALSGLQGVYDRLAKYYAAKPKIKEIGSVIMKVAGVKLVTDVVKITNYLETLTVIKTATWIATENGYNFYRVFYQGARGALNNLLAAGRVLRAEDLSKQSAEEVNYRFLNN